MGTYDKLVQFVSNGKWHSEDELGELTPHPRHWVNELRHWGHEAVETDDRRLIRRSPHGPREPVQSH